MSDVSRRDFMVSAVAATVTVHSMTNAKAAFAGNTQTNPSRPVVIASGNGEAATKRAMEMITAGKDTLDAVIAGVNIVEEDPNDMTVGYGGLPNEDGVVELDSCVMHGPTCRAGSVAAIRGIKTPSKVAKLVMDRTDHVMIVGEGALRFAKAHGLEEVNLLTDRARRIWLKWKESHSDRDDWLPPAEVPDDDQVVGYHDYDWTYGTINCCAVSAGGDISGVTTTSGLSYKIPGRVGDSPIIGAGLYVDNKIGAAGATGRGEAVIKVCGAHSVVENMRHGLSPMEACLDVLKRIVDTTTESRLKRKDGKPNFNVSLYAVSKRGEYASAAIWSGATYAVNADGESRVEDCAFLYKKPGKGVTK